MSGCRVRVLGTLAFFAILCACSGGAAPTVPAASSENARFSDTSNSRPATILDFLRAREHWGLASVAQVQISGWTDAGTFSDARSSGKQLIYISEVAGPDSKGNTGDVAIYSLNGGTPVLAGKISGLDSPSGLALDRSGALYVCQTDRNAPVLVFPFGSTHPSLSLNTYGAVPSAVAVKADGIVVVGSATPSTIRLLFYKPGSKDPFRIVSGGFGDGVGSIAVDDKGNVYVHYATFGHGQPVAELRMESRSTTYDVGLPKDMSNTQTTIVDHAGRMLLEQDGVSLAHIAAYEPASTVAIQRFQIATLFQSSALEAGGSTLFGAAGSLYEYAYPSGNLVKTIALDPRAQTFGLTTYPPRQLPPPWKD